MNDRIEHDYFERRAREERALQQQARDVRIGRIHAELAVAYERKVEALALRLKISSRVGDLLRTASPAAST